MDLDITEHIVRIALVRPNSRIDAFNAPTLRDRMLDLVDAGISRFIIDLSSVPFFDSAGMAMLVSLLKRARASGGDVALVWPVEPEARNVLLLTKFDRVFRIYESADEALSSL